MTTNLNRNISELFEEIADMLELQGDNPFKISAFRNSARVILNLPSPVDESFKSGELKNVKGIGKATLEKIAEYIESGQIIYHAELMKSIPDGIFEILKIKGLGPKKVKRLWNELEISSIGELEYACKENRLILLNGFGEKTQKSVLENIEFIKLNSGKFLASQVYAADELFNDFLKKSKFKNYSATGVFRRKAETYSSIEYLIATDSKAEAIPILNKYFKDMHELKPDVFRAVSQTNIPFIIRFCSEASYPLILFFESSSEVFLTSFFHTVEKNKFHLSPKELREHDTPIQILEEADIFNAIGIQFIRPELRDEPLAIEMAEKHVIPELINISDIKGALHIHTTWSDGRDSLESMVKSAISFGFEYIGFCDHSQSAFYANGLKPDRLLDQWSEIDKIQKKYSNIKIFKGIESDILKDGSLDYDDDILKQFDFIVASIHSNFKLSYEEMTDRLVNAASNQYTTILGHPSGRLLLSRESYKFDWDKVLKACKDNNTAIELNSDEHRLDASYQIIAKALKSGIKISIDSDAHSVQSLGNVRFGVGIINKTFVKKEDILNSFSADEFLNMIRKTKTR